MRLHFSITNQLLSSTFFIFCFFILFNSQAQEIKLTPDAQISVVVVDPGTAELYEAFGHPAIRVYDPARQLDVAFNYGIFDFDQPHFYLNFTRGYLNYMVADWPYPIFKNAYIQENRSIKEYVLKMSPEQKQAVFDFLANNVKPENRNYFYDYFYDNCSTRIWDVFSKVLGENLHFDENYTATGHSFRTLVDSLTVNQPWGDFGIDLCLGLPMDKKLSAYEYMYLPEFLGRSLSKAKIIIDGQEYPFVESSSMVYESASPYVSQNMVTPSILFWSFFGVIVLITIIGLLLDIKFKGFDLLIFGVTGLIGLLLLILWVATDHKAAANNLNIIWANPLYLVGLIFLVRRNNPWLIKVFFAAISVVLFLFLATWPWNPQGINLAVIPISLSLLLRAIYVGFFVDYAE